MKESPKIDADKWVDSYGDTLFRFALARVKDRDAAEDLVQETFAAALKARAGFRGKSSEKTWLFSILKHKVIDHFRRKKLVVYPGDLSRDAVDWDTFFDARGKWRVFPQHWGANPDQSQEVKEFLDHFYRCLSALPRRTADVFVHREIDGLDTPQICKHHDITSANCWVILYRARMLLRKCLELVGFGQPEGENRP